MASVFHAAVTSPDGTRGVVTINGIDTKEGALERLAASGYTDIQIEDDHAEATAKVGTPSPVVAKTVSYIPEIAQLGSVSTTEPPEQS